MTPKGNPSYTIDDEVTSIARRYRLESLATLISVCRNEDAPASARAAAASKLLEYSDGNPSQGKPITISDMPHEAKVELFFGLVQYFDENQPGVMRQLMTEAYIDAARQLGLPKPNKFTRGSPEPTRKPLTRGNPPPAQSVARHPVRSMGEMGGGSTHGSARPLAIAYERGNTVSEATGEQVEVSSNGAIRAYEPPPETNVVALPYGLKYGLADSLDPSQASTPPIPSNGIHPDVVRRSARPPSMAMDLAFQGYGRRW